MPPDSRQSSMIMPGNDHPDFLRCIMLARRLVQSLLLLIISVIAFMTWNRLYQPKAENVIVQYTSADDDIVVNGLDQKTGLIAKGDFKLVKTTCTACHSSSIILRSRLSRNTWIEKIRWMQAKQKLWDLGINEKPILDYLEKYYGPESTTVALRRQPLKDIIWYKLDQ